MKTFDKKIVLLIVGAFLAAASFVLTACAGPEKRLPTITLTSEAEIDCFVGVAVTIPTASAKAGDGTDLTDNVKIILSDAEKMELDGTALTVSAAGTYTITYTVADKEDTSLTASKSVTVKAAVLTAPVITLSSESALKCYAGESVTIPEVSAQACDGTNLTGEVEITLSNPDKMSLAGTTLTIEESGDYTVTYTVADKRDSSQKASKSVTVKVYRKMLSAVQDDSWTAKEEAADAEQTLSTSNEGFTWAKFNIEPNTLYYAETTFDVGEPSGNNLIGMGHFVEGDSARWLGSTVDRGDRNFNLGDFDTNNGWNWGSDRPYCWQLANYRGLSDPDAGKAVYAIARVGDYFYSFINGQYIACITIEYYRDLYTIPGIFGHALNTSTMSGIVYCTGAEAQTKIDALLRGNAAMISKYAPGDWALHEGSFTINDVSDKRGVNFDYTSKDASFNGGMVSPYLYLDGDFTFQWEYKNTEANSAVEGGPRMLLEIRPWDYGNEVVQFGADYGDTRRFLLNVPQAAEGNQWHEPGDGFDDSKGARFTITRQIKDGYAEYTMTATSIADPTQTYTRVIQWNGDRWDETVLMLWHNTGVAGEYSNIKWSIKSEDIQKALTKGSF